MPDLRHPWQMILKALLFVLIGLIAAGLLILRDPAWTTALLLALCVWGFSRAYYFAFYVIGHYIDPRFRFAGLFSAVRFLCARRRPEAPASSEEPRV